MPNTLSRTIHFFDVKALSYDPVDRAIVHPADIESLFNRINTLRHQKGVSNSSFAEFWGIEAITAIDLPQPQFIAGRFMRVRQDGLPGILSMNNFARLALNPDEFIYETSHFVYFKPSNTIAVEYNQHAPNIKAFVEYLKILAHRHTINIDELEFPIKVDPNTIARLERLGIITSCEASMHSSQVDALQHAGGIARALRATANTEDIDFKAAVSLQRERPAKNRPRGFDDRFKQQVIELWTESGDLLTSLKVWVEPVGGGKPQPVDFKRDRFSAKLEIALTPERSVDTGDIYAKIIKYYNDSQIGEAVR